MTYLLCSQTVPHVTHCTIKGKFHPANCYYQQAKGLFENGIKNKDLLPAHHILNDSHATTPPDPVEENASQFLDTILKNLFGVSIIMFILYNIHACSIKLLIGVGIVLFSECPLSDVLYSRIAGIFRGYKMFAVFTDYACTAKIIIYPRI